MLMEPRYAEEAHGSTLNADNDQRTKRKGQSSLKTAKYLTRAETCEARNPSDGAFPGSRLLLGGHPSGHDTHSDSEVDGRVSVTFSENDLSDLHTPQAVAGLEESVRCDLATISSLFVEGARLLEGLEEALRVLPASQSRLKGWRLQIENIVGGIVEEQSDVTKKLLGGSDPNPISESVNEEHTAAVLQLKREA